MIPVTQVPVSKDLSEFTQFLWVNEIPHRVTEDGQSQTLWVSPNVSVERVRMLFEFWQEGGSLNDIRVEHQQSKRFSQFEPKALIRVPMTLIIIGLSIAASLLVGFGTQYEVMNWLSFTDFEIRGDQIYYDDLNSLLASGEYWRILTPIFMHFSVLHILFNLLWVWVIGRRVEQTQGALLLASLVVFTGAISNLAQFLVSGPLFGGMSGVVFALLAYTWTWDRLVQRAVFGFPPMLMGFMLFWLALGYSGALEKMGLGAIANTAHLAGLVAGLAFALVVRLVHGGGQKT